MKRIVLLSAAVTTLLMLAAACGDGYGSDSGAEEGSAAQAPEQAMGGDGETSLDIRNFKHQDTTIQVGDTLVWTQQDSTTHTITSGSPSNPDGVWASGNLKNGQSFSRTFTQTGSFPYFCEIHPSMIATITVVEAGSVETTSPPETTTPTGEDTTGSTGDPYGYY